MELLLLKYNFAKIVARLFVDAKKLSPGTICASIKWSGSHVKSRLHVFVDYFLVPSSTMVVIGFVACLIFFTGAEGNRKCPVVPES